jgi:hypothetical protein
VLSLIEVYVNASSSLSKFGYKILGCANAWYIANRIIAGINVQIFQLEPAPAIKPLCKDGINQILLKKIYHFLMNQLQPKILPFLAFSSIHLPVFLFKKQHIFILFKRTKPWKGLNMLVSVSMVDV